MSKRIVTLSVVSMAKRNNFFLKQGLLGQSEAGAVRSVIKRDGLARVCGVVSQTARYSDAGKTRHGSV